MADAFNFDGTLDNDVVEHIIANAPNRLLDCRTYYWTNFKYPGFGIMYHCSNFQHTISLGCLYDQSPTYIASFDESLLLTWIGIECSVQRRLATSYKIQMNIVNGMNRYADEHQPIFTYYKVTPPINRFEPQFVHGIITSDKIDTGKCVHVPVHKGYNVELIHSCDEQQGSTFSLMNVKVVLKVQHPSRVGGMIDHPSWDKSSYKHSYNIKEITSYSNYNKYVLKGDDALYYR